MIIRITNDKKKWVNVKSFSELNDYIISSNSIKDLISLENIREMIEEILSINVISKTELIKHIKNILSGGKRYGSIWKKSYWYNRGYSEKESIDKVKLLQSNNSKKYDEKLKKQGYSKEEIHKIRSDKLKDFFVNKSVEYKRRKSPRCIEFWLERCNEEEAIKKCREFNDNSSLNYYIKNFGLNDGKRKYKEKCKKSSLPGEKNGMFGKPPPQGSGNGWSGWYKNYFFRSLLELSYIYHMENSNINFISAENKKFKIEYKDYNGKRKNYFPDFYLPDIDVVVEVKPKKFINSKNNSLKFDSAKKIYGKKFKIITDDDIEKISLNEIKRLHNCGDIRFIDRYEEKLRGYINESDKKKNTD